MSHRLLWLVALVGCTSNAATLVRVDPESAGTQCEYGGLAVNTGIDKNHDGVLQDGEISATQYVCNGGVSVRCAPDDVVHEGSITIHDVSEFAQLAGITCVDGA